MGGIPSGPHALLVSRFEIIFSNSISETKMSCSAGLCSLAELLGNEIIRDTDRACYSGFC